MKKIDRFVDPIVVMSPEPGVYWTPNGNHRRTVLEKLKAKMVPAILVHHAVRLQELDGCDEVVIEKITEEQPL